MKNLNKKQFLIGFLAVIWFISSIWTISIFTIFQAEAGDEDNIQYSPFSRFNYSWWVEDNTITLQQLNFTEESQQSDIISSFFMRDNSVILTPSIIISWTNNSGNILWWVYNTTNSENAIIIWWAWNTIEWDGNKTILWWERNNLSWNDNSTIVWWAWNRVEWDGTIIWWTRNTISETTKNSFILWWEGNTISGWENIIVAWEGINADNTVNNSFIFSNRSDFSGNNSNTFYIDARWGLWINWDSTGWYIASHWWLSIWEIPNLINTCDENKIGIIWTTTGCLISCTQFSANEKRRSLIETSQRCVDRCHNNPEVCHPAPNTVDLEHEAIPWFCTWYYIDWSSPCFSERKPRDYKDVVFSNNYVDECPENQSAIDNPCTFKCPEWSLFRDGACKKSCTKMWDNNEVIIIPHWESIRLYNAASPTCPSRCIYQDRQCNDWTLQWNLSFHKTTCQISEGNRCDSSFNIEEWEKIAWSIYDSCTEYTVNWNSCSSKTKHKLKWCNNGYTNDNGECKQNCTFNGQTVLHGKSITWYLYKSATCDQQDQCNRYRKITCEDGSLWTDSIEYKYSKCNLEPVTCPGFTISNRCPDHWICSSCTWYRVDNNKCTQFINYRLDSCEAWYKVVWNSCYKDCTRPWGGTIQHGDKVVWYKATTQTCPSTCEGLWNKKEMVCNDGNLDGSNTYKYPSCNTQIPESKWFKRFTEVENAECETEIIYSVNNGMCIEQQTKYNCTQCKPWYTHNGQDWDSDNAECLKNCTFKAQPWNTNISINWNGWTITTYSKWSFECPDLFSNYSETRTCYNGTLDGSYTYTWYTQKWKTCQKYSSERKTFDHQLTSLSTLHVSQDGGPCTEYTYNSSSCTKWKTYYTYICEDGYNWNNAGNRCVKCTWEIPDNAHKNNSKYPTSSDTEYTYNNTDTSAVCTFSCNPWFERDPNYEECIDKRWQCYFDWVAYDESYSFQVYSEDRPICSNTCNEFRVSCSNGIWYDDYWYQVASNFTGDCKTVNGYKISTASAPINWTCSTSSSGKLRTFMSSTKPNKSNANRTKTCTNYQANNRDCQEWNKYRTFYCPGTWKWTAWNEECYIACTYNNKTYENWESLTLYNKQGYYTCPTQAQSQTRTCNNGSRSDWWFGSEYKYTAEEYHLLSKTCENYPTACYGLNDTVGEGNYEKCQIRINPGDNTCFTPAEMCRITGCSTWYTMINGECKKDCELNWKKIAYWQSITGYKYTTRSCPSTCSSSDNYQVRTCGENWKLDGSDDFKYTACFETTNNNTCPSSQYPYENRDDIPAWSTIKVCRWYTVYWDSCEEYIRYGIDDCEDGYSLVNGECKKDCDFKWKKVKYLDTVVGYRSANCGSTCPRQTMTCGENWQIIWDTNGYPNSTCYYTIPTIPANIKPACPNHWICTQYTYYEVASRDSIGTTACVWHVWWIFSKCDEGYTHIIDRKNWILEDLCMKNCNHNNLWEIAHWGSITAYKFENWTCKSIIRECNNGILSGDSSYNLKTCETCKDLGGAKVLLWDTITRYKATTCPNTSCESQTLTCTSEYVWKTLPFSLWYAYSSCKVNNYDPNCSTNGYIFTWGNLQSGWIYTWWCRIYTYKNSSCQFEEHYKLLWCKAWYTQQGNKCLAWCETPRNSTVPHWKNMTWYKETSVLCLNSSTKCVWEVRACSDWKRYKWWIQTWFWNYTNPNCSVTSYNCQSFPLSEAEYQANKNHCGYQGCTVCTVQDWVCVENGTRKYVLTSAGSWYYATGAICSQICGNWTTTPCNWPYTATWIDWQIPNTNRRVNLRWTGYKCVKNNNSVLWASEVKCADCPTNYIWNWNRCVQFPNPLCNNTTLSGCNLSYPTEQRTIEWWYTWTCKNATDEQNYCHLCYDGYEWDDTTKTCKTAQNPVNWICEYWKSWPSCISWTVINHTSSNQCSHSWTCKWENWWKNALCSMHYNPGGWVTTNTHYILQPTQWTYQNKCKSYYPDTYNSSLIGSMTFTNDDKCGGAISMWVYVSSINGSQIWSRCNVRNNNLPTPGCGQCFLCNFNYKEQEISEWECYIEWERYDEKDPRCNWIRSTSCYPQATPSDSACEKYELTKTNQYWCNISNVPNTTYTSLESCRSAAKSYWAVRSQSYWIWNTSWTIWDSCNIDTDPYCIPCVSCTSYRTQPPASCSVSCSSHDGARAFGNDPNHPSYGNGSSSDPLFQINSAIRECTNNYCGHPATVDCDNVTYVKCCTN